MAITNKGAKWEWKNSWFVLLSLIFPISFLPFFIMNGRAPKKKYLFKGFACILVGVIMVFSWMFSNQLYNALRQPTPESPKITEYLSFGYASDPDYKSSEEYKRYQDALTAYYNSKEYKDVIRANTDLRNNIRGITTIAIPTAGVLFYLLMAITALFLDRPRYLRDLEEKENRAFVTSALQQNPNRQPAGQNPYMPPGSPRSNVQPQPAPQQSAPVRTAQEPVAEAPLDINRMTEEEFQQVSLLNIIDVKNIINFRNQNGSFTSKEQFFDSFRAKPHVMAKLQDRIVLGSGQQETAAPQQPYSSRRFDL